ncbi:MAG: Zn-ribbon domain-containing OB-fold protein [Candidatus Thorarchaeota archaeon]
MSEKPSVDAYKQFIKSEDFHAYKCVDCGAVIAPPSGSCYTCGSSNMEWTTVKGTGKLVSFTIIHIAPEEFQTEAPYYIGIVELDEGTRVTCRLKGFDPENPTSVRLGTPVVIDYEHGESGNTYLAFRPA